MEINQFLLIALILYLMYKILEKYDKMTQRQTKVKTILKQSIVKSDPSVVREQAKMLEDMDGSDYESDSDLFEELKHVEKLHFENYEMLVRLLRYSRKHGNTTLIQNITGPSNNNNLNLGVQVNLLPIFPMCIDN